MKFEKILILFIIIGCILAFGYFSRSTPISASANTASSGINPVIAQNSTVIPTNSLPPTPAPGTPGGQVIISIGDYEGQLPVFIDTVAAGNVSKGKPLRLNLAEGTHLVSTCEGTVCESLSVDVDPPFKTTVDFGERLKLDALPGFLTISTGNYPARVPVFIDAVDAGFVMPGMPFNQTIPAGNHTVSVCPEGRCFNQTVTMRPGAGTSLDFGELLTTVSNQGSLRISIGGYEGELPVLIDNTSFGTVALGRPLDIRLNEGNHTVKVCAGKICEQEEVRVQFAKPYTVDFGERLENDVEFQKPAARIVTSYMSGSTLTAEVEFINPDAVDRTITATISCVYSFNDARGSRQSSSAQTQVSRLVKGGDRGSQMVSLGMGGGSDIIANEPVVTDVTVK
jgi:hypothetical protein